MPVDIDEIFARGGKKLVDLLDYAVRAVQTDLLFVFLVREYREHPSTPKAVALFDGFCAPRALARISASESLPPVNLRIDAAMRPLKLNLAQVRSARTAAAAAPPLILPPKYLFDAIDLELRKKSSGLLTVKRRYRIRRTPLENLPGGRMNAGQKFFVEKVWEPILRPRLVAAGFRRVGSIA
jgi:hypothetical protein